MKTFKFKDPNNSYEKEERFLIIEDRDDRVLAESTIFVDNSRFKPTFVYLKSDLIEA